MHAVPDVLRLRPKPELTAANHGPLLLTTSGSLDAVTKAEIRRVLKPGGTVFLLGGTAVLSAAVAEHGAILLRWRGPTGHDIHHLKAHPGTKDLDSPWT